MQGNESVVQLSNKALTIGPTASIGLQDHRQSAAGGAAR